MIRDRSSGGMPTPVSATATSTTSPSAAAGDRRAARLPAWRRGRCGSGCRRRSGAGRRRPAPAAATSAGRPVDLGCRRRAGRPPAPRARTAPTGDGRRLGHRHPGEVRQRRDHAVGQLHLPLDPLAVLGPLLGRGVAGVEQVVDRGLHHVQRVAQLVGHARRPPGRASPAARLRWRRPGVLGLVGVLDDRQVEVEQLVQRPDRRSRDVGRSPSQSPAGRDQPGPEPRQGDVGVDLVEADLDVPPADPPAALDVSRVVRPGEAARGPSAAACP